MPWSGVRSRGPRHVLESSELARHVRCDVRVGPFRFLPTMISASAFLSFATSRTVRAEDEEHDVGVLLERAGFAQVRHHRSLVRSLFELARQLRERNDRALEFTCQIFSDRSSPILQPAILRTPARTHQLQVVNDHDTEVTILLTDPTRSSSNVHDRQCRLSSMKTFADWR